MTPQGLGMYFSRINHVWAPAEAAGIIQRLQAGKIKHVAMLAEAVDGWQTPISVIQANGQTLRNAGITVSVFSLPGRARVDNAAAIANLLLSAAKAAGAVHVILDAEEAYRGKQTALRTVLQLLRAGLQPGQFLAVTTYGRPSWGGTYPWDEIKVADWLGHQVYENAASQSKVHAVLDEMRTFMGDPNKVLPHLATYARQTATTAQEGLDGPIRLKADFDRTCFDGDNVNVPGVFFWSWASTNDDELRMMADLANEVGWL